MGQDRDGVAQLLTISGVIIIILGVGIIFVQSAAVILLSIIGVIGFGLLLMGISRILGNLIKIKILLEAEKTEINEMITPQKKDSSFDDTWL
jgi:hypothetical protein